jgi:hypothetical protein
MMSENFLEQMDIEDFDIDANIDTEPVGEALQGEINLLVDQLFALKGEKAALQDQIKDLDMQLGSIEFKLLRRMEELGVDKMSVSAGSVSRKVDLYPTIVDMDAVVKFCYEENRFDFLQKRVNSAPFKEYFERNNEYPPGLDGYYKETLNTRRKR